MKNYFFKLNCTIPSKMDTPMRWDKLKLKINAISQMETNEHNAGYCSWYKTLDNSLDKERDIQKRKLERRGSTHKCVCFHADFI